MTVKNPYYSVFLTAMVFWVTAFFNETYSQNQRRPANEDELLYHAVPDIIIDTGGASIHLSRLWNTRPLLLTFVFTECRGICRPYLRSFNSAVQILGGAGRDYYLLVLSFDTTDNIKKMRAFCTLAGLSGDYSYILATAHSSGIQQIGSATGFWFDRTAVPRQYDHPAEIVGIANGQILRILTRSKVSPLRLKEVVTELKGLNISSYPLPSTNIRFRCFQPDPETDHWKPAWGLLILFLPLTGALLSTLFIFFVRNMESGTIKSKDVR